MDFKDYNNNDIEPGDYIIYPSTWGQSPILKYGKITRLENKSIRAITVDKDYGGNWMLQKNGQEILIYNTKKIIVVPSLILPEEVLRLLDGE